MDFVLKRVEAFLKKRISSITAAHTTLGLEDNEKVVIGGVGERDNEVTRNLRASINPLPPLSLPYMQDGGKTDELVVDEVKMQVISYPLS